MDAKRVQTYVAQRKSKEHTIVHSQRILPKLHLAQVYVSGKEKTIVFGGETREVVLENMSDTSLGDIQIVTVGVDSQESTAAPITIPKPPQKAEILKAIQGEDCRITDYKYS